MKFQNIILSTIAAVAMTAACEDNALDEVTFEEEEQDIYASENAAENLFETLEAITNSGLDYSQNQEGHIAANNELSTPKFTSVIKNGKLTWPDGSFITYDAQKVHTWELDKNLEAITLNVEGTARGTTRRELDFRSTITSALTFQGQCIAEGAYLASGGKKRIEVDGRENHILVDYSEGACDNTFSITIGEVKADITLD